MPRRSGTRATTTNGAAVRCGELQLPLGDARGGGRAARRGVSLRPCIVDYSASAVPPNAVDKPTSGGATRFPYAHHSDSSLPGRSLPGRPTSDRASCGSGCTGRTAVSLPIDRSRGDASPPGRTARRGSAPSGSRSHAGAELDRAPARRPFGGCAPHRSFDLRVEHHPTTLRELRTLMEIG
jgi:hypothetical protein